MPPSPMWRSIRYRPASAAFRRSVCVDMRDNMAAANGHGESEAVCCDTALVASQADLFRPIQLRASSRRALPAGLDPSRLPERHGQLWAARKTTPPDGQEPV